MSEEKTCEMCGLKKATKNGHCESCESVINHWRSESKRMGLTLEEYLIKTSKWD